MHLIFVRHSPRFGRLRGTGRRLPGGVGMGRGNRLEPTGEGTVNISPDKKVCCRTETNGRNGDFADSFTTSCTKRQTWVSRFQSCTEKIDPPKKHRTRSCAPCKNIAVFTCRSQIFAIRGKTNCGDSLMSSMSSAKLPQQFRKRATHSVVASFREGPSFRPQLTLDYNDF